MLACDAILQLSASQRVGELETATKLFRHKLALLTVELNTSRERNSVLQSQLLQSTRSLITSNNIDFTLSVPREGTEIDEDNGKLYKEALLEISQLEIDLASCRLKLLDSIQLVENQSLELTNFRLQIKEKNLDSKAIMVRHLEALTILKREKHAVIEELDTFKEQSRTVHADNVKSIQELSLALHNSQQQICSLREELNDATTRADTKISVLLPTISPSPSRDPLVSSSSSTPSFAIALETCTAETTSLRLAYESACLETREASEEAQEAVNQLLQCRAELCNKDDELLLLSEQLVQCRTELRNKDEELLLLSEQLTFTSSINDELQEQLACRTQPSSTNETTAITNGHISATVTTKSELLLLVEQYLQIQLNYTALVNSANQTASIAPASPSSFGWKGRARHTRSNISRSKYHIGGGFPNLAVGKALEQGDEDIEIHDVSVDYLDSDDELALPSLDEHDVYGENSTSSFNTVSDSSTNQTVVVTISVLSSLLSEHSVFVGPANSKIEQRLQSERDNLSFERDSYREEIMRFLEIDAVMAAAAVGTLYLSYSTLLSRKKCA